MKEPIIVGLDIGSATIKTVIARVNDNTLDVIGIGKSESIGIRKGVIINIDAASEAIRKSVTEAQIMSGLQVPEVVVSINGDHIQTVNSKGVIGVNTKNKDITQLEITRVLDSAKNIHLPPEREILEAIEQEFSLDGQDEIKNPIGMSGTRLEADVHIITGLKYVSDNIKKTLHKIKLLPRDIITSVRGSAEASLTQDEKDLGVILIDIGHSTTSIAVFIDGSIWHTAIIPIGGQHITNDIATGLRVTNNTAEELKCDYGVAFLDLVAQKEIIEAPTPSGGTRTIPKRVLTEIIQPRIEEILSLVARELIKVNCLDLIASGIVYTGGSSFMPGLVELTEAYKVKENENIASTSRVGYPDKITGITDIAKNPAYCSVIGIMQMSMDEAIPISISSGKKKIEKESFRSILKKKNPFSEFFK